MNKDVYELKIIIESNIQRVKFTYISVSTVVEAYEEVSYLTECFNSLELPVMPSYVLYMKIGVPIMLRFINQPKLCNGMRLAVKYTLSNVADATISTRPLEVRMVSLIVCL